MPIFEALKGSSNASETIDYCEKEIIKDPETGEKKNKCVLKAGVNCDIADIRDDFAETRNHFNKTGGRQAMHFVLSFDPKELSNTPDNQEKCLEIGMALAEKIGKGHESGCFVHADQDHLHCHIVTNSVNYETGRKFQMKKDQDLVLFRNISDKVCKEHGIEPLEPYQGENVKEKNAEKRIKARGKTTWKEEIREAIKYAKSQATDMQSYKKLLAEKGVEMYERGENTKGYIHITQRDLGAKTYKIRDRNKALDGGYHLEDVYQAFEENKQRTLEKTPENHRLKNKTEDHFKKKGTSAITEKRTESAVSSMPSIPKNDGFEETIQNSQEKKQQIKANTIQDLKAAEDEAKRIEIKKKEQIKLEQAEIEKQIELKNQSEVEAMFRMFQKTFPRTTYKDIE
ncbi:relaxase/mobilization nuclease domain-containing protein, partial [Bacillus velezensis]